MGTSAESGRRSLERVREALDKVRRVLRDLDQRGHPPTLRRSEGAGATPAWPENHRDDMLRAHEAARLLKMTSKDVYAAVRDYRLPATRFGRFLWFRRADVEAFAGQLPHGGPHAAPK
jgi:excisionase family DNA binding protein